MKVIAKGLIVCLALSGLGFAASNSSPQGNSRSNNSNPSSQNSGSTPDRMGPTGRGINNSAGEAPLISPNGTGTTERSGTIGKTGNTDRGIRSNTGMLRMSGTIESIDRNNNRIRIRNSQGQINEYQVNDKTNYTANGNRKRFSDVQRGDSVSFESNPELGIINLEVGPRRK